MKVEGNDSYQGLAEDGGGENMEVAQEDLYQVCGVTKEATPTELKKSYRKVNMHFTAACARSHFVHHRRSCTVFVAARVEMPPGSHQG